MNNDATLSQIILVILGGYFILNSWATHGPLAGMLTIALIACLIILYVFIGARRERNKELAEYARVWENIYICHDYAGDRTVEARARHAEAMVVQSNNEVHKKLKIKVHRIFFRDHLHGTETWDEYLERRDEFIKADRAKRCKAVGEYSHEWYVKYGLEQIY